MAAILLWGVFVWMSCKGFTGTPEELYGNWTTAEWTIDKTGERINGKMDFRFDSSGRYLVDYGSEKEKGAYSVEGDRLYTTEDGQARKYVKIIKLTADSLALGMNRAGRLETLILIKQP